VSTRVTATESRCKGTAFFCRQNGICTYFSPFGTIRLELDVFGRIYPHLDVFGRIYKSSALLPKKASRRDAVGEFFSTFSFFTLSFNRGFGGKFFFSLFLFLSFGAKLGITIQHLMTSIEQFFTPNAQILLKLISSFLLEISRKETKNLEVSEIMSIFAVLDPVVPAEGILRG